jgi:predicted transposase YbfD/YdcC
MASIQGNLPDGLEAVHAQFGGVVDLRIWTTRGFGKGDTERIVREVAVESDLHWRLDVVMNEDQDRTRLGHGPHNLAVLRHMALNAMQ